jgi:anti-sigma B factor antagonist
MGGAAPLGRVRVSAPRMVIVGNRQELRTRIRRALEDGASTVVVDLEATTYLDSSGIGMLLAAKREAGRDGKDVVLEGLDEELSELLRMMKLDRVFAPRDQEE